MSHAGGLASPGELDARGASGVDALWIVGGLALVHLLIHLALNSRYDLHRDEMAVVDYARHLDWGFVEFPPLTPALVRLSMALFGESAWGARVLAAVAMALMVLLAGLMARDLGGGRGAQVLAAAGAFASLFGMLMGSMTLYAAFDFLWWVAVAWALVRRRSSDNPRWWLAVGLLIGLGVMTKYTMVILGASVFVAVLLSDLRRDLRTAWPWLAVGIALLVVAPNLLWQSRQGWVAIEFTQAIHARDVAWGRSEGFWLEQLYANASPVTLPLWLAGLGWLVFAKEARPWRFLAWLYLLPLLAFGLLEGRSYYTAATYTWLMAAGAVAWEVGMGRLAGAWRTAALWGTWALGVAAMLVAVAIGTPIAPINSRLWELTADLHDVFREQLIWPEMTATVAEVYAALPAETQTRTAILAGNYGEAGALNWYGPRHGLPRAIATANTYWLWGYGDPARPPEHVIAVGLRAEDLNPYFSGCVVAATVPNLQAIENEETRWHRQVFYCAVVRHPWEQVWPAARSFM